MQAAKGNINKAEPDFGLRMRKHELRLFVMWLVEKTKP